MLAQVGHIRDRRQRLIELDAHLAAGCVQHRLRHLPSQARGDGQARRDLPGVVDIGRPFVIAEIGGNQSHGDIDALRVAQQQSAPE